MLQGFLALFRFSELAKTPVTPDTFELPAFPLPTLEDRMTQHGRHRAASRPALPKLSKSFGIGASAVVVLAVGAVVFVDHPIQAQSVQPYIDVKALYEADNTDLTYRNVDVTINSVVQTEEIDFNKEVTKDSKIATGTEFVLKPGVTGTQVVTYSVKFVDGIEVSRHVVSKVVKEQPVDAVVIQGTGDPHDTKVALQTAAAGVGTPQGNKDYAQIYIQQTYGWSDTQFTCLSKLWTRESNWRTAAHNRQSGAHGIAQALPGKKMATIAEDWRTNPVTQIKWGSGYIKGRYGTPCNAWNHSENHGWY